MVETTTAHYGWTKPEVTKSASTWGGFLNGDLDSIDALVFANQQGIVPIGAIQMFGGAAAPANWLLCNGASLVRVAPYDKLFAIIGTAFGAVDGSHFNVPNLAGQFPMGVAVPNPLGQIGGTFSYTLAAAHLPAHTHPITDTGHIHVVNQWSHTHGDGAGHAHTASQVAHSHTYIQTNAGHPGLTAGGSFAGAFDSTTGPAQPAITVDPQHVSLDTQTSNISIQASGSGITAGNNTGGGTPLVVVPKYLALNFIIRFS